MLENPRQLDISFPTVPAGQLLFSYDAKIADVSSPQTRNAIQAGLFTAALEDGDYPPCPILVKNLLVGRETSEVNLIYRAVHSLRWAGGENGKLLKLRNPMFGVYEEIFSKNSVETMLLVVAIHPLPPPLSPPYMKLTSRYVDSPTSLIFRNNLDVFDTCNGHGKINGITSVKF